MEIAASAAGTITPCKSVLPLVPGRSVAVARALANDPGLILADEPTAALDGPLGRQVMELFAKIAHERQAGVIVVTHDHRTLDVFDRILDVEDGMIQIRGNPPPSSSPAA